MAVLTKSLGTAADLVADLLAETDTAAAIPGSDWTVRQAAVHLVAGTHLYASCLEGVQSPLQDFAPATLAAFNGGAAMALAAVPDPDLADHLARAAERLGGAARETSPERAAIWHAGTAMPAGFIVRTITMELLLHGGDIAGAAGTAWKPPEEIAATAAGLFGDTAALQFRRRRAKGFDGRYQCDTPLGPAWAVHISAGTIARLDQCSSPDGVVRGPAMTLLRWTSGRATWGTTSLVAEGPLAGLVPRLMECFSPL